MEMSFSGDVRRGSNSCPEEERMELSLKERDRISVLRQGSEGVLAAADGAARFGATERRFRRVPRRFEAAGDEVVVHGLRGRRSNRSLSSETRERSLANGQGPRLRRFRRHVAGGACRAGAGRARQRGDGAGMADGRGLAPRPSRGRACGPRGPLRPAPRSGGARRPHRRPSPAASGAFGPGRCALANSKPSPDRAVLPNFSSFRKIEHVHNGRLTAAGFRSIVTVMQSWPDEETIITCYAFSQHAS